MLDWLNWALGGRPMVKICFCFVDVVSGRPIYLWRDLNGRYFMAEHRWSWFRVESIHAAGIWRIGDAG
jgi:hypothetical protein